MFLIESGMNEYCINEYKDLVNNMLISDVEKRFVIDDILNHVFVSECN